MMHLRHCLHRDPFLALPESRRQIESVNSPQRIHYTCTKPPWAQDWIARILSIPPNHLPPLVTVVSHLEPS